jgi:hypothetical protein
MKIDNHMWRTYMVGRTPWSARVPLDPLLELYSIPHSCVRHGTSHE